MSRFLCVLLFAVVALTRVWAQAPAPALASAAAVAPTTSAATTSAATVWRCGNAYTNQPDPQRSCTALPSGTVTVIEGPQVRQAGAKAQLPAPPSGAPTPVRVEQDVQRERDAQAKQVLQTEVQRMEQRMGELQRQWNQGEPVRLPEEARQPHKYQARVSELRNELLRTEADLASLRRELGRLP